jgi:hypothetical protein
MTAQRTAQVARTDPTAATIAEYSHFHQPVMMMKSKGPVIGRHRSRKKAAMPETAISSA